MKYEIKITKEFYTCDLCGETDLTDDKSDDYKNHYVCLICGKDICTRCMCELYLICGISKYCCQHCSTTGDHYVNKLFETQEAIINEWYYNQGKK